jgi:hypothetical protein
MALTGALCVFVHAVAGFTTKAFAGWWPDSSAATTRERR